MKNSRHTFYIGAAFEGMFAPVCPENIDYIYGEGHRD